MSNYTHETVPTQFVEANGIRYAYRRFGKPGKAPLLFLGYFNSNMDAWDPAVTNVLTADHELILFDNAGVGASGGRTPSTVAEMTQHCVAFCRALGLKAVDIVGFSLGGMIAQQLALSHPDLVRRLILLGTGPRGGEGMTFTELSPEEQADPVAFLIGRILLSFRTEPSRRPRVHEATGVSQGRSGSTCFQGLGRGAARRYQRMGNHTGDRPLCHIEEHHASDTHRSRQ
jgi:pimeloyl-ACP methyl ester carboxylesterase